MRYLKDATMTFLHYKNNLLLPNLTHAIETVTSAILELQFPVTVAISSQIYNFQPELQFKARVTISKQSYNFQPELEFPARAKISSHSNLHFKNEEICNAVTFGYAICLLLNLIKFFGCN